MNKSVAITLLGTAFLVALLLSSPDVERPASATVRQEEPAAAVAPDPALGNEQTFLVTHVVDGDTIELENGMRVRYIGIDTPETVDPRKEVECFGVEARARNKQLVEGKRVRLEKDVSETDKYGRLLRYVYIDEVMVNRELVEEGYAHASTYPPDVKHQAAFTEAERQAREAKRGLWSACTATVSVAPSTSPSPAPSLTIIPTTGGQPQGCTIKGNISSGGKIYHLPGCGSYDKTQINEAQGEHWFCGEEEALAAGWRKAKNCP